MTMYILCSFCYWKSIWSSLNLLPHVLWIFSYILPKTGIPRATKNRSLLKINSRRHLKILSMFPKFWVNCSMYCTCAKLSQDLLMVTGFGKVREGGRDIVMELGKPWCTLCTLWTPGGVLELECRDLSLTYLTTVAREAWRFSTWF